MNVAGNEDQRADEAHSSQRSSRRPGFRRLGLGGAWLALQSLLTIFAVSLVTLGGSLGFRLMSLEVAGRSQQLSINGQQVPIVVAVAVVLPVAVLGAVSGVRLWMGWPPGLAVASVLLWIGLGLGIVLFGGSYELLAGQLVLLLLIVSGALAGRPSLRL